MVGHTLENSCSEGIFFLQASATDFLPCAANKIMVL